MQRRASAGRAPGVLPGHPARAGRDEHAAIRAAAARGIATPGSALPHAGEIQRSFGRHDISSIQAHVGPAAAVAATAIGADAYTTGNHVVLGRRTDLFTAAHEAAHVVQQRAGVRLPGGVGSVGDPHERHADAVADAVVAGRSAEPLLDGHARTGSAAHPAGPPPGQASTVVQRVRSPNPRPSEWTGHPVPDTPGAIYSEHHIIPHNLLLEFWRIAQNRGYHMELISSVSAVLGDWEAVTVKELISAGVLDARWFADDEVTRILGRLARIESRKADDVFHRDAIRELQNAEQTTAVKRLVPTVIRAKQNWHHVGQLATGGELPDVDLGELTNLVSPYYEWIPGNLVVGPEGGVRANDPHERYDEEAASVLSERHRTKLSRAYAAMEAAVESGDENDIETALLRLRDISHYRKPAPPVEVAPQRPIRGAHWRRDRRGWELHP